MEMAEMDNKRACWVDVSKLFAMIAVIVNHTTGILYTNLNIAYASYFSVSLFIVTMGVTTYWSFDRKHGDYKMKVKKSCLKIIIPYLVATLVYCIWAEKQFVFSMFLDRAIHFSACGPFYYVMLYVQLLLVSPILYYVLAVAHGKRYRMLYELVGFAIVVALSVFTTNNTNILDVYGGGGKLFGGTYLILLYIGMLFGKYCNRLTLGKIGSSIVFFSMFFVTIIWWYLVTKYRAAIDSFFPFGDGINPPGVGLGLCAILMMSLLFFFERVFTDKKVVASMFEKLSLLGRHTLYIFLYHMLLIDYISRSLGFLKVNVNHWIKIIIYFICIFIGGIAIEWINNKINQFLTEAYK
ncbi:acyltransferase family protein [Butyrivibrio sp. YAB3001]|uniref:acyltransferase family protein n=1 Tax=Butyrivibrio sp. YAB3001 TaxID=1520812 RepID=UPI0008F641E9|nr:acyltransferase [Butyrivibrio sp. YAB3001]SFC74527.1 Surface polysaccharide O-acyltransferase, integral membrane enzyme [Butyrivibrio sp. YAB3001]